MMITPTKRRPSHPLRIYLIDLHPVARLGLRSFFENMPSVTIVGEGTTLTAALPDLWLSKPDMLITDIFPIPQAVLRRLRGLRVLYTFETLDHCSLSRLLQDLTRGRAGFVLKNTRENKFRLAVRQVAAGRTYQDPVFMRLVRAEQQRRAQNSRARARSPQKPHLQPTLGSRPEKSRENTATSRHSPKRKK